MNTSMSKVMDKQSEEIESIQLKSADLLEQVHESNKAVAELFFQFTQEEGMGQQEIFDRIKEGMTVHAQLVEDLVYPLVIDTAEEEDQEEAEKLVAEAEAGNYIASLILDELSTMDTDEDYFEAKMTILCELTKLQVKREEKEIFDKLRASDLDFEELGVEFSEMKEELEEDIQSSKSRAKSKSNSKSKSTSKSGSGTKGGAKTASKTASKNGSKGGSKSGGKSAKASAGKTSGAGKSKSAAKGKSAKAPASKSRTSSQGKAASGKKKSR